MHQHGKDGCLNSDCSGISCNNDGNNSSIGGGGGQTSSNNNHINSNADTNGRFISHTFPLVSRSSIKRPLSLTQDRDHHHHSHHYFNKGDSIMKDHRHYHHRGGGGGGSPSTMVGPFRTRAKTIHSTDSYHVSAFYQSDSSSSSSSSCSQSSFSSAADRRQAFRNMIEFRKKTRKAQQFQPMVLTNTNGNGNSNNHNHHDPEEKIFSSTSKSVKISEQILDEEMVTVEESMIDRNVVGIVDEDDGNDDVDLDSDLIESSKSSKNNHQSNGIIVDGRKDFDGIPPDPNNPFFKFFNNHFDYNNNDDDDDNGQQQQQKRQQSSQSSSDGYGFWSSNISDNSDRNKSRSLNFWSINHKWSNSQTTATTPSTFSDETGPTNVINGKCDSNGNTILNNIFNDGDGNTNKPSKENLSLSLFPTLPKVTISSRCAATLAKDEDDRCDNKDDIGRISADAEAVSVVSSFASTTSTVNAGQQHIPTEAEKEQFQRSLDSATTLVFHRRSGLPLNSSPAPIRKSGTCFDFDSSLTSVNAIKKALFHKDPDGKDISNPIPSKLSLSSSTATSGLLGNFEESVLNGRLDPASIVHGFTAEIGASGGFCPSHKTFPVTVFFYTLQDTDKGEKMSSPYLGHINLGEKGYHVPRQGTVQVTLFNPNGTVVKMFVVRYDLTDMPPNSRTFLRQRTLFMPSDANEHHVECRKWLRYLIHLRFQSSKSGRIRLHTDIRILVFRKHDLDVATMNGGAPYELRSFVQMPSNPKYSKNIKTCNN